MIIQYLLFKRTINCNNVLNIKRSQEQMRAGKMQN